MPSVPPKNPYHNNSKISPNILGGWQNVHNHLVWCNVDGCVGEEGLKIGRARICRRGNRGAGLWKRQMSGELWEALLTSPVPACSSGAESAAVTLKLYHFHPEPGEEARAITLLWNTGRSHHSFTHLKERKVVVLCPFIKLIISIWLQTVSAFSLYSAAWLIFFFHFWIFK